MAKVSIYLNFMGNTEEAFNFYKTVFNSDFVAPIMYNKDVEGMPPMSESDANSVMHVAMPILDGFLIMGTDMLESMGHQLVVGNNTTISLDLADRAEADKFYNALAEGSTDCAPMSEQFWGYWGCCLDKYGIRWMFNVSPSQQEA